MRCLSPTRIVNPKYGEDDSQPYYLDVACNKCYACLANRRREWFLRLLVESEQWPHTYFITLTYDGEVFCDNRLHKDHLQKFLKKLNRRYTVKYYAIGEYGTHTFRPHYHAILFSKSDLQPTEIQLIWNYGFIVLKKVLPSMINYVLHYHTRPKWPPDMLPFIDESWNDYKAFGIMSKGLGKALIEANEDLISYLRVMKRTYLHYRDNIYVFPRYYRKKYGITTPDDIVLESNRMRISNVIGHKMTDSEYVSIMIDYKHISDMKRNKYNLQITQV